LRVLISIQSKASNHSRPSSDDIVSIGQAQAPILGVPHALEEILSDAMPRDYAERLERLIAEIEAEVRATSFALGKDELDPGVLEALRSVPRHEFVPQELRSVAYLNRPLPIGCGQTISQPYIVAIMSDLLRLPPAGRVLEIGTGCGYQAAVLSRLCAVVYSIEIVEPLGYAAQDRLARLGYDNVHVRVGDGYAGWPKHAPFDGIIVTAAAPDVPRPLQEQLKPGGRMLIPLRAGFGYQQLVLVEKGEDGVVTERDILPVMFVPLTGGHD
jgi:protein-L-isoaspartate(D-aspartate) O-methyltransferase